MEPDTSPFAPNILAVPRPSLDTPVGADHPMSEPARNDNAADHAVEATIAEKLNALFAALPAAEPDSEDRLRQALAELGGALLFHMRLDDADSGARDVAAVSLGPAEARQVYLVSRRAEQGDTTIEPADAENPDPLARLAWSYAELATAYALAA